MGFFIIGWDEDTVETYHRTLDFCDECNLTPFIFTLHPTPGSQVYREYLEQGHILKRTLHATRRRVSTDFATTSFFTQLGLRKTYRQMHDEIRARYPD